MKNTNAKSTPRKVMIILMLGTYFIKYVNRKKFQRHSPGQFYAKDTTIERVKSWCAENGFEVVE